MGGQIDKTMAMLDAAQGHYTTCPICGKLNVDNSDMKSIEILDSPTWARTVFISHACADCAAAAMHVFKGDESRRFQRHMVNRALEIMIPKIAAERKRMDEEREKKEAELATKMEAAKKKAKELETGGKILKLPETKQDGIEQGG